jgi:hypothetical protein
MTLLELIVGLTVTGVTVSAGFAAFASMMDHRSAAEEQVERVSQAADTRRTIVEWLEGARLTVDQSGPQFRGLDGVHQGLPDDDLSFLTASPGAAASREAIVRLYIDRDSVTPERGLTAEITSGGGTARTEIEPHADGLDLLYSTTALGKIEWLPSWISATVLPLAVQVQLTPAEGDSLPPLLRLPMVVPIGSGR